MLMLMFNLYHSALTVARNCGRPVDSEMYSAESSKNLTEFISIFISINLLFNDNTMSRRSTYQWQRPSFSKPWWEYKRGAASVTIIVIINHFYSYPIIHLHIIIIIVGNHYILQGIGNGGNAGTEAPSEMMLSQPFIPMPKLSIFAHFYDFHHHHPLLL